MGNGIRKVSGVSGFDGLLMEQEEELSLAEHAAACYENMEFMVEAQRTGVLTLEGEFAYAECIADGVEQLVWLIMELEEQAELVDSTGL